ncbi:MAG: adenosylcobinamide-GDP ribazoletransferase [Acidobacteriaceae bacterium]
MSIWKFVKRTGSDFLAAVQFLTRAPMPNLAYDPDSLSRSVKFFPVVGLLIGSVAALLHLLIAPHLPRLVTALLVIVFLAAATGCLHEDGLADTADGFGGGSNREQILVILKDSRIGSYGGVALTLSLLARVLLLASLPLAQVPQYLIAAHVLCRWTTLPLSYYLAPARSQQDAAGVGQGARIASLTTRGTLLVGSIFTVAICIWLLRTHAAAGIVATLLVTLLSGLYFQRRIRGVTGDCFGAANQLAEIAVYLTGAWIA